MNICRFAVECNHRCFTGFSANDPFLPVYVKEQFLPSLREEILIREGRLHGSIYNRKSAVIINLGLLSVKGYENKVITFFIKADTDTKRRNHERIFLNSVLLQEDNIFHDFFASERNTFFRYVHIFCNCLGVSGNTSATTYYKYCTDRFVTVQLLDLFRYLCCHGIYQWFDDLLNIL